MKGNKISLLLYNQATHFHTMTFYPLSWFVFEDTVTMNSIMQWILMAGVSKQWKALETGAYGTVNFLQPAY